MGARYVPALSVRQPFIWCIAGAGKRIENRSWGTNYRGPLLLHASKSGTKREFKASREALIETLDLDVPELEELPRGGICLRAKLVDCLPPAAAGALADDPWYAGEFAWRLAHVEQLEDADGNPACLELAGRQGLFDIEWIPERKRIEARGWRWRPVESEDKDI